MAAIYTENLAKVFTSFFGNKSETQALKGLSLEVKEGETFGFLGPKRRRQNDHHSAFAKLDPAHCGPRAAF
jgi:hypothetical protein